MSASSALVLAANQSWQGLSIDQYLVARVQTRGSPGNHRAA
jgi:hypothetical protein